MILGPEGTEKALYVLGAAVTAITGLGGLAVRGWMQVATMERDAIKKDIENLNKIYEEKIADLKASQRRYWEKLDVIEKSYVPRDHLESKMDQINATIEKAVASLGAQLSQQIKDLREALQEIKR